MTKELTALAPSTMKIKVVALQSGSIRSGSEDRSYRPCLPFSRCGSQKASTMNLAQQLCTASVSELAAGISGTDSRSGLGRTRTCRMDQSNVHSYEITWPYPGGSFCMLFLL